MSLRFNSKIILPLACLSACFFIVGCSKTNKSASKADKTTKTTKKTETKTNTKDNKAKDDKAKKPAKKVDPKERQKKLGVEVKLNNGMFQAKEGFIVTSIPEGTKFFVKEGENSDVRYHIVGAQDKLVAVIHQKVWSRVDSQNGEIPSGNPSLKNLTAEKTDYDGWLDSAEKSVNVSWSTFESPDFIYNVFYKDKPSWLFKGWKFAATAPKKP